MSPQMTLSCDQLLVLFRPYDVRYNGDRYQLNKTTDVPFKAASVLIPLFYKENELHVLLTVRSKDMPSHAGQVAFPGGMSDPSDVDAIATAFREAHEEVGINRQDSQVIAVLPTHAVRPNSLVSPVVALIPNDFTPVRNEREVDLIFDLPLKRFFSSRDFSSETISFERGLSFEAYHYKDMVGETIVDTWGFTASLCLRVAIVIYQIETHVTDKLTLSLHNCFDVNVTQFIIDSWSTKSKL